jgi:hypothetical protein
METRSACGGAVRIIACVDDPEVIKNILTCLDAKGAEVPAHVKRVCIAYTPWCNAEKIRRSKA